MYCAVIKHSGHLRTLEKCRKHLPAAGVFYISIVFSNARRVLSQCNTRLKLLYLLNSKPLKGTSSYFLWKPPALPPTRTGSPCSVEMSRSYYAVICNFYFSCDVAIFIAIYRKLAFYNVLARQGSSFCIRARLNFQGFSLRD